jgi:LmbE family N-acetylglucosaminyl deacetylase
VIICSISAHPADSIAHCGGTLAKYADNSHEVFDICVTDGRLLTQDYPEKEVILRRAEARKKAGTYLGFKEVRDLGYADLELPYNTKIVGEITDIIRETKPDIILTNWHQCVHPDLRNLAQVVSDAIICALFATKSKYPPHQVKKLYVYSTMDSVNFTPQLYIDITDYIEKKREALNQFILLDQIIRKWEGKKSKGYPDLIIAQDRSNGLHSSVTYAEAYREFVCVETKSRAISFLPI